MSKLLLKAIPANATSATADQTLGYVDTTGSTQRVSVKAQPKTVYRLVDAKTGEVIKNQTVLRQGKHLLVTVDGVNAVDLDNFFPDEAANATAPVDSASYLVDTGAAGAHTYGAVTAQTPVEVSANGMSVLWTPGMAAVPVAEPVAFGAPVVAAVSGVGSVGGLAALGLAAAAGNGGGSGGSSASKPTAKITGSAFKAEVADNTGLVVEAFDSTGKSRGKANVGADGKYSLTLDDSSYKGSLVLKMYDGLPDDGKTPKFYDEATGETKDFTKPLYAVVNYGGDGSDIKVNVTPLTNLAATVAGVDTTTNKMTVPDGKTADQVVKEANTKVAQKFGLNVDDLTAADVQTTKSDTVNAYGVALAVMSKMEQSKTQDEVANLFKTDSTAFTSSLQTAVTALKNDAGSNNEYLKNIDTSKLDKVSEVASDTTAPLLVTTGTKANTSSDGTKVYLHFDSELSKNTAGVDAFTVSVTTKAIVDGGADTVSTSKISSVAIDGNDVVLTLATAIVKGQAVTVSYTDPTAGTDDLLAVQDVAGNDAANISATTVVNNVADVKPVITVKAGQSFNYDENQVITETTVNGNTVYTKPTVATVDKGDGSATPTKFRFTDSQSSISKDGWYSIDKDGNISLTSAGLGAGKASNDFETKVNGGNALVYGVQAGDDAGNWSASTNITLNVNNVTPEAPTVSAPVSFTVTEDLDGNLLFDKATFANVDSGNTLAVTLFVEGNHGILSWADSEQIQITENDDGSKTFTGASSALNAYFSTAGNLSYQDDTNFNGTRVLDIKVSNESGTLSNSTTSKIKVLAVNDAPRASSTSSYLTAIAEDNSAATGDTVKALFGAVFDDSKDEVANGSSANTLAGVAINGNAATDTQGVWQWSADGASWKAIATSGLADATALYLAADAKLRFVPTSNYNGTPGALTARLVESSATALTNGTTTDVSAHGGDKAYSAITIDLIDIVIAINDAPTVTAPATFTVNEDTAVNLLYTGTPFADIDSTNLTVTLSIADGTISATTGGNVTVGGTAIARTFTSTAADLNTYFTTAGKITYTGAQDANGIRTLTTKVDDGSESNNTATSTTTITINAVNDAPTVTAPATFTVSEDTAGNLLYTGTPFADIDSTNLTVTLSIADGTISATTGGNVTVGGTAIARTFTGTAADLNTFFTTAGKITYTGALDANGTRTLTTSVSDGSLSNVTPSTTTITINPVNDAPVRTAGNDITLNIDEDSASTATSLGLGAYTYSAGGGADETSGNSAQTLSYQFTNIPSSITLYKADGTTQVTVNTTGLTQSDMQGLKYKTVADANDSVAHNLTWKVTDSGTGTNSITETLSVKVNAVNDAPVNTLPAGSVSVEANTSTYYLSGEQLEYSSKPITGLSITDVDAGSGVISVTLSVEHGSLAHIASSGVTFTDTSSSSFTASGNKSDLNDWLAAINGVTYTPEENSVASDTLTMSTSDGGNSGSGGTQTDTDSLTLNISDTRAPELLKAETSTDGKSIVLTYDEALDVSHLPDNTFYSLSVTDGGERVSVTVESVSASNQMVTLGLSQAIQVQQVVKLNYSDPNGNTADTVQDVSGNDASSLTDQSIDIKVPDLVNPKVTLNQSFDYTENQTADAVVAAVVATDNVGVTGYRFANDSHSDDDDTVTYDGFFKIDSQGHIHITEAGIAANVNNYENLDEIRSKSYEVQVFDANDNYSDAVSVTLNVKNVNEAPTGTSSTFDVPEDYLITFDVTDFGFADTSDSPANALSAVIITTLPSAGILVLNGKAVTVNQSIPVASIGLLSYTPPANAIGNNFSSIGFKVQDNGGTADEGQDTSVTANALTLNFFNINDAPTGTSSTVTILEDGSKTFAASDFGFADTSDSPANALSAVIITTLPSAGTLKLGGTAVTVNQSIPVASLGNLVYAPAANANGNNYASIGFKVQDNGGTADEGQDTSVTANTLTIHVTPVNDAPTGTSSTVTILEDGSKTFAASDFGFADTSDSPANALSAVIITTLPIAGTLKLGGTAVTVNQSIPVASLGNLVYAPAANANGSNYASIGFMVQDNGGTADDGVDTNGIIYSLTFNVTPVNDEPTGTSSTVTILEDGSKTFAASDFGFADTSDSPANALSAVIITTLPSAGTLKLGGTAVTVNQSIPVASLGNLVYAPAANANGNSYATIGFKVRDDGGGATDTSVTANTLTINVTPVNDAPTVTAPATFTVNEDTAVNLLYTGLPFADVDSTNLTVTLSIADGTISATTGGNVTVGGTAVARTFTGTAADLNTFFTTAGKITYTGAQDANGTRTLTTSVSDGYLTNVNPSTTTITINALNDAPTVTAPATFTVNEDTAVNLLYTGIPFADIDSTNLTVTLSIADGTISATTGGNVTVGGTAIARTFTGTAADLNTYFTTAGKITYTGAQHANGARTLTTSVSDGYLTNVNPSTTTITINALNDAPTITTPAGTPSGANSNVAYSIAGGFTIADVDAGSSPVQVNFQVLEGAATDGDVLNYGTLPAGVTLVGGTYGTNHVYSFQGTISALNAWMLNTGFLKFTSTSASDITASIKTSVSDLGNTGTGGALTANGTTLNVNVVSDSTPPVFQNAVTNTTGDQITLTYNEALSATTAGTGAFAVSVAGSNRNVTGVSVSGGTVVLTLASAVANGQTVTVGYTDPTANNDVNAVQDIAGNDAITLAATTAVTNNVPDTTVPIRQSAATNSLGTQVILTYSEALSASTASPGDFSVKANGTDRAISSVSVSGNTVVLTLASPALMYGESVAVGYADPTANNDVNAVQDLAGNDAVTFSLVTVTNNVVDAIAPTFQSAATNQYGQIILTYSEALSATTAATTAFAVTVGGAPRTVSVAQVIGSTVLLTLSTAVASGDTVTISYTDPSANNDSNAVQDSAGNDAVSLAATSVTNNVPDTTPPVFQSAATDNTGKIVLTYNEALSSMASGTSAFYVYLNGGGTRNSVTNVAVSGNTVILTLTTPIVYGNTATVQYVDSDGVNTVYATQDLAGNDAATMLSAANVVNNMPDTVPPVFQSAVTNTAGTQITLTYDENLSATTAATNAFSVSVDYVTDAVSGISVSGRTAVLTLATPVLNGQTVTVGYTDPTAANDANAIQDILGNDAVTLSASTSVANNVPDTTGPLLKAPVMDFANGGIQLRFNELLDSTAAANVENNITITADGILQTGAYTVFANYSNDILALRHSAISSNFYSYYQSIKISYTDPSAANDTVKVLQDAVGNDAASFNIILDRVAYFGSTVTGTSMTDYIMGGNNDDTIIGGQGNDTMWGYQNFDLGSATSDNDVFKWNSGDAGASGATDTIKDFTKWNGTSGDKLSIYGLLSGFTLASSPLEQWVKAIATGQTVNGVFNSTVMTIDVDGPGPGTVTQVIQFEGINLLSGVSGITLAQQLASLKTSGVFI